MDTLLIGLLLLVAGLYFAGRNVRFLRNEKALREYMQTSPKAAMWVKKYGLDGATTMARRTFMPLGIVVSIVMAGVGAWVLWRLLH